MPKFYRARESFVTVAADGTNHMFGPDPLPECLVPEGHWVLATRADLFEEFDLASRVEQATAAPGEKRRGRPPGSKNRPKPAAAEPTEAVSEDDDG